MQTLTVNTTWALTLSLATARAAGATMTAPVFGEVAVPKRLRALLAVVIALAVVGRVPAGTVVPDEWLGLALSLAGEVAVGVLIGYAARLVFVGVELGAMHVGQQMGVALAEAYDEQAADSAGAVRRLFWVLALVIFLALGGHREIVAAVLRTFQVVPLAGFAPGQAVLGAVVALLGASFALAIKVAAPVLIAMLLATVAMGLLQRTFPQLHIFSTGFPVRAMLGLVVLAASVWVIAPLVDAAWSATAERLLKAIEAGK
jgi:flagellar biosynthetic protein FliR